MKELYYRYQTRMLREVISQLGLMGHDTPEPWGPRLAHLSKLSCGMDLIGFPSNPKVHPFLMGARLASREGALRSTFSEGEITESLYESRMASLDASKALNDQERELWMGYVVELSSFAYDVGQKVADDLGDESKTFFDNIFDEMKLGDSELGCSIDERCETIRDQFSPVSASGCSLG